LRQLAPDEEASEDPALSETGEVDILDLDGPFLSYEYRGSRTTASFSAGAGRTSESRESLWRGVLDLRSGSRATLRGMFGAAIAESLITRGYQTFATVADSIRAARGAGDERARRAAAALTQFTFDPLSFSLTDAEQEPVVQFFAPGRGIEGGGLTLPLPQFRIASAASVDWWRAENASLPTGGADSATDVWRREDLEVLGRYDTLGVPGQGQGVVLSMRATGTRQAAARREWRVGRFPAPTRRVFWLDQPPVDSASRRALVRAFDEAALYGDDARTAAYHPPAKARHRSRTGRSLRPPSAGRRRKSV
jgi:hypothetical protein